MAEGEDKDTFRILVCTDTHVGMCWHLQVFWLPALTLEGYNEKDPVRGLDSFNTWDEILEYAKTYDVDFILHGGDLFHENRPSRKTLYKTMESIRRACLGDREIMFELLSDQTANFPSQGRVNYDDPNLNIGIPIFIIHGNHDDPSGDGQYSAIDLLAAAGLVNYFGASPSSVSDITISPILLRKGTTQLALYGLGNIRDERLNRTFREKKVKFLRPGEEQGEWFNVFAIHQNRVPRGPKNYIKGSSLSPHFPSLKGPQKVLLTHFLIS